MLITPCSHIIGGITLRTSAQAQFHIAQFHIAHPDSLWVDGIGIHRLTSQLVVMGSWICAVFCPSTSKVNQLGDRQIPPGYLPMRLRLKLITVQLGMDQNVWSVVESGTDRKLGILTSRVTAGDANLYVNIQSYFKFVQRQVYICALTLTINYLNWAQHNQIRPLKTLRFFYQQLPSSCAKVPMNRLNRLIKHIKSKQ